MTPSSQHARQLAARTLSIASLSLAAFAQTQLESSLEPLRVETLPSTSTSVRGVEPVFERLRIDEDRLDWDVQADGVVWAMGHGFKASFGPAGASITPFLGSDAQRNYPVTFSLERASVGGVAIDVEHGVQALHGGANVRFERGAIVEAYDLDARSIEQSFDLHAPVGVGDLTLRIAFESELVAQQVEQGIEFRNERGGLDYSHAVAIDARGEQIEMPATLVDGAIEIVVPAGFLANAAYPVRVDPTVTVSGVDVSTLVHRDPDVSYDYLSQRSVVAFVRVFSAIDRDVYAAAVTGTGNVINGAYIDSTSDDWTGPRVATQHSLMRHLVVAARRPAAGGESRVFGRIVQTSMNPITGTFQVSGGEAGSIGTVDVGGNRDEVVTGKFLVAWSRQEAGSPARLSLRVVDAGGAPQGTEPISVIGTSSLLNPSVAQASHNDAWTFVWEREVDGSNRDVLIGRIQTDSVVAFLGTLATTISDERRPSISIPMNGSNRYLVTYERRFGSDSDVLGALIDDVTVEGTFTLTDADGSQFFDTVDPYVEGDGSHFVIGYTRAGVQTLHATELYVLPSSPPSIGLVSALQIDSGIVGRASISSLHAAGIASRRQAIVWSRNDDIWIGRFDGTSGGPYGPVCFGDGTGTACPCGNNGAAGRGCANSANAQGARLAGSGNALIGGDTLLLQGSGMPPGTSCLYFQGTATASPATAFGDGLRCATGTIVRLGTKLNDASGASSYPGAGEQAVSVRGGLPSFGGTRGYQLWYRNAASFCTSSTFNLSNGFVVTFTP